MALIKEKRQIHITRQLAHHVEKVFEAWSDPRRLQEWWSASDKTAPGPVELSMRPAGRFRLGMREASGKTHIVGGLYREVKVPRKLVHTWRWETGEYTDHETLVEVDFIELGPNTRIEIYHNGFETDKEHDEHLKGWNGVLDQLGKYLSSR